MERRRETRLAVELPGTYGTDERRQEPMFFSQLSSKGCRLAASELALFAHGRIAVFLGPVGPIAGTVRWIDGTTAGVEFDTALDAAIVTYFAAFINDAA